MANKQNKAIVKNDVVEYFKDKLTNIKEDADWTDFSNNLFTGTSGEKQCLVTQDINTSHIPAFLVNNDNFLLKGGVVVFGKDNSYPSIQLGNTPNKLVSYSEINVPITSFGFKPHITLTLYYSDKKTKISEQVSKTSTIFGVTYDTNWDCVRGAVSGSSVGNVVMVNRLAYAIGEIPDNTKIVSFIPKTVVTFTDDNEEDTICYWRLENLQKLNLISGNKNLISSTTVTRVDMDTIKFEIIGKENALTKNGITTGYTFSYSCPSPIAKGKIYIHQVTPPSPTDLVLSENKLFATIAPNVDMTVTVSSTVPSGVYETTFIIPAGKRYSDISSRLIPAESLVSYEASGGELFYEYTWGGVVEKVKFLE